MGSCKKFLSQPPYNRISVDDIFKDFDGARTTLVGLYDNLKFTNYYLRDFYVYPEITGGNIRYSRSSSVVLLQTNSFANDALNNDFTNFYKLGYATIYGANNILANIDKVADANIFQKNRMMADGYAIRAICHFDLVRVFAQPYNFTADASHTGIIIKTKNSQVTTPSGNASSVAAVYSQITSDLDSAMLLYANSSGIYATGSDKTWLSADAAKALLGRVELYRQGWNKAIALSSEIINSSRYALIPNSQYVSSWLQKNISTESIFEMAYGTRTGGSLGDYYNPNNTLIGYFATSADLLRLYSSGDIRDSASMFVKASSNNVQYYYTKKYQGRNDSANNIKIVRLSEIYLNRAEAYAETNNLSGALNDLNLIRRRANPTTANFTSTDQQAIINEILLERRRELAFEGHLFFDLARKKKNIVRTDCTASNCSLLYPDPRYAIPIPVIQ